MTGFLDTSLGSSGVDTGDIPASLRFRGSNSSRLNRTQVAGNRKTFTWSWWVKLPTPTAFGGFWSHAWDTGGQTDVGFSAALNGSGNLSVVESHAGTNLIAATTARVFRDPTTWLHFVVSVDTTQAVSTDRLKIYVNGIQETSLTATTYPAQNTDTTANMAGWNAYIGMRDVDNLLANGQYLEHFGCRYAFVDGAALTPSSFGYLNTEINEWVSKSQSAVKAVVDAGGANSFMLDFDDATSLTTLGYDKSSKGNNWTLNNFSLTAGTSYDRMLDVPGNSFATWNPLDPIGGNAGAVSLGNLYVTSATSIQNYAATTLYSSGKYYAEFNHANIASNNANYVGVRYSSGSLFVYGADGQYFNNVSWSAYGSAYTTANIISVAVDTENGTLEFFRDGVSQGVKTGMPTVSVQFFGSAYILSGSAGLTLNAGQYPFAGDGGASYYSAAGGYFRYTPPSGYKALCQRNMPDPAILNPELHFDVVTWSGDGNATKTVSGLSLSGSPDLLWAKERDVAQNHTLYDSVKGWAYYLASDTTGAESAIATYGQVQSVASTGYVFTKGSDPSWSFFNRNGGTYVGWNWKAGGAAVTNNAGSISSQVSANVTAGFSIVTGTVQASGTATMGHGLGKVPALIIGKRRGNTSSWVVFHWALGYSQYLVLNSTAALVGDTTVWQATPTTSVFSLGTAFAGLGDYVFYCFAEIPGYSKFFYYTGNGSADGPFVHCGFKPKFVLIKRSDNAFGGDWLIIDTTRDTYNVVSANLFANAASAESSSACHDTTSTGFKVRSSASNYNASGGTYIGIAFADVPAKYSLGR